jgi:hypothetical protein
MRKVALSFILILLSVSTVFSLDVNMATSYEKCTSFEESVKISVGLTADNYDVLISEYGLKKIDIDARIGHEKENGFFTTGLVNSSYSYELGGWSGLGFLFNYAYTTQHFYLKFGLGIQSAVSYSQYQSRALFAFTPLVDLSLGITVKDINAMAYLNLSDPYEREWKALPTVGLKVEYTALEYSNIFVDVFVKFAEYMTDPVTLVMGYGCRIGTTINCDRWMNV